MIYILNSPILTDFGTYTYKPISIEEAKEILKNNQFISAIGHESTAKLLSEILNINIKAERIQIKMSSGDVAIVFQVLTRLPEGKILTKEELKNIPFRLGLLTMNSL
jgi:hypothetical protein